MAQSFSLNTLSLAFFTACAILFASKIASAPLLFNNLHYAAPLNQVVPHHYTTSCAFVNVFYTVFGVYRIHNCSGCFCNFEKIFPVFFTQYKPVFPISTKYYDVFRELLSYRLTILSVSLKLKTFDNRSVSISSPDEIPFQNRQDWKIQPSGQSM